ncbi:MAG TPA: hypothetical protein VFR10_13385 [bacterium]|nr:hypothetical protein [bacterium]
MIPLLACALVVWTVDPQLPWFSQPREGRGPRVALLPEETRGMIPPCEFHFRAGDRGQAGYAQIPIDGDRLAAHGLDAIEIDANAKSANIAIDVVLVSTDEAYRATLKLDRGRTTTKLPISQFRGDRGDAAKSSTRIRFFRFESPKAGLLKDSSFEIYALRFRLDENTPSRIAMRELETAPLPPGRSPLYPFGVFILGGNRSLLEPFALAGANTTVEYGPRSWPRSVVADHLAISHAMGVHHIPVLARETGGGLLDSFERLDFALRDPTVLAVVTIDEPDGAAARGLRRELASPQGFEDLREKVAGHGQAPVFAYCMDSFGLSRYEEGGDILGIDLYLPAYGPERSFADIYSTSSSAVEIAARAKKTPFVILQLGDPQWPAPAQQQSAASMRAQSFAALAAGARGLLFFQAVSAVRQAQSKKDSLHLWNAFTDLAGEFATMAPVISNWKAIPGEPALDPPLGEVRAAAFAADNETWIVVVNLGRKARAVKISGAALRDAQSLKDVYGKWEAKVSAGEWRGTLQPLEARVLRVEKASQPQPVTRLFEAQPQDSIRFDRAVLGATLYPAPVAPRILVDGKDRTSDAVIHQGAATVLRLAAHDLPSGEHEARISWKEGSAARESTWTFTVEANGGLPIRDRFSSPTLDRQRWAPIEEIQWSIFDEKDSAARGQATIVNGQLHLRSTGGSYGVLLKHVEAPPSFDMTWTVELSRPGEIAVQRNEILRKIDVTKGKFRITLRERPGSQVFFVGDREVARFSPLIDHQGGAIGIGVGPGGEADFDDFVLEARSS